MPNIKSGKRPFWVTGAVISPVTGEIQPPEMDCREDLGLLRPSSSRSYPAPDGYFVAVTAAVSDIAHFLNCVFSAHFALHQKVSGRPRRAI